jgi:hypothetical protein
MTQYSSPSLLKSPVFKGVLVPVPMLVQFGGNVATYLWCQFHIGLSILTNSLFYFISHYSVFFPRNKRSVIKTPMFLKHSDYILKEIGREMSPGFSCRK